ncbi:hypothetical protein C7E18_24625, partial [Stenotrophomonas maltophilia]
IELAAHAPDVVIVPIGGGGLASGVALALKSQGVGIELAAHAPDVVIVPIGGGGLASGVALALKSQGV